MRNWSFLSLVTISTVLLAMLLGGCSSSAPSTAPDTEPSEPARPAFSMLYASDDEGLVLRDARRDTIRSLRDQIRSAGMRFPSPSGQYVAFAYRTADSSHAGLLDARAGRVQTLHSIEGTATYSFAWHPQQDRIAFGYYRPQDDGGRGPGGIRIGTVDGASRSVGCSAAREVLDWLPDGTLATRTDDNLYIVSASDCSTQSSIDARRMHQILYAPDGRRMAFIHRELTYDREAGDYVPDSSFVLADARGREQETLFQDRREVRHPRWAPDASELAFDVRVESSGHRQIAVYTGDRTVFLVPPNATTSDQVHPRWSPSGNRLAFTLRTPDGPRAAVRVKGTTRHLGPVDGAVWGWLNEREMVVPGPDSVRVQTLNGQTKFSRPAPNHLLHIWKPAAL